VAPFVFKKNNNEGQRFVPLNIRCLTLNLTYFTCLSASYPFKICKLRMWALRFHRRVIEDAVRLLFTLCHWVTRRLERTVFLKPSLLL